MADRQGDEVDRIIAQWNRERPDLDVGPMALLGRLARLTGHLGRALERNFAQFGLNSASFDVLATLRRSGAPYALSPGELLATMMITSGTLTNRIDQLERAGMVTRTANPQDRRSLVIGLTDKGFATVDACVTAHCATQAQLVAVLDAQDRAVLNSLFAHWLEAFEDGRDKD